jgi:hypothetical protein
LKLICEFLHFANSETISNFRGPKKLFPVISHVNNRFQELYLPNQDISIDESLTLWNGCLSFNALKIGIKTYEPCDAITGYLWSFLVYAGKDTKLDSPLITADTNKTTVDPLLKQGWTVWMDNFYNSPCLAKALKNTQGRLCRYTKIELKNFSKKVKDTKLNKSEIIAQHSCRVSVTKWRDKIIVTMISTYHIHDTRAVTITGKEIVKAISVLDYNQYMGGVDLKDQPLHSYLIERKRMNEWYMNTSVLNAMIMYRNNTGKRIDQLSFRIHVLSSGVTLTL